MGDATDRDRLVVRLVCPASDTSKLHRLDLPCVLDTSRKSGESIKDRPVSASLKRPIMMNKGPWSICLIWLIA
jgi:hypothetical protein